MKYPIGLEVIVKKPKKLKLLHWAEEMDVYNNTTQIIQELISTKEFIDEVCYTLVNCKLGSSANSFSWRFSEEWLTPSTELGKLLYG